MKGGKRRKGAVFYSLIMCMVLLILLLCVLLLFQVRAITVTGINFSQESDVLEWIQEDEYAVNSIYIWLRYHGRSTDLPPAIESIQVILRSPWHVELAVTERNMIGFVRVENQRAFFDEQGMVLLITEEEIPGPLYVEELEFSKGVIRRNQPLPTDNVGVFSQVAELAESLRLYEIVPDRIVAYEGGIKLFFDNVIARLGNQSFHDRVAQIEPILERLAHYYPGRGGTLHLEGFERFDSSIRFVPN